MTRRHTELHYIYRTFGNVCQCWSLEMQEAIYFLTTERPKTGGTTHIIHQSMHCQVVFNKRTSFFIIHTVLLRPPIINFNHLWSKMSTYRALIHFHFFFSKIWHLLEWIDGDQNWTNVRKYPVIHKSFLQVLAYCRFRYLEQKKLQEGVALNLFINK